MLNRILSHERSDALSGIGAARRNTPRALEFECRSLWIACTDSLMDAPLAMLPELASKIVVRQPGCGFPGRDAAISRHISTVQRYVEDADVRSIVVCGHSLCSFNRGHESMPDPPRESAGASSLLERTRQRELSNNTGRKRVAQQVGFWSEFWAAKRPRAIEIHGLYFIAESNLFTYYHRDAHAFVPMLASDGSYSLAARSR